MTTTIDELRAFNIEARNEEDEYLDVTYFEGTKQVRVELATDEKYVSAYFDLDGFKEFINKLRQVDEYTLEIIG